MIKEESKAVSASSYAAPSYEYNEETPPKAPFKPKKFLNILLHHLLLAVLAIFWLIPIVWLLCCSFSSYPGMNINHFFPEHWTLGNYKSILMGSDTVAQFPKWFWNTMIIAIFTCIISSCFVLMVSYAMSCMRFKARKPLMNVAVILNLFPGFLSMIAVYFILKSFNLTNSHVGMVLVYSASSGLGYLVAKGFFDTVPVALREAAYMEGASEFTVFTRIVIPLSKPIIVYTVINSFLSPWMDFIFAKIILNSGISSDWTVAIGLYNMLDKTLINQYFSQFCAGGVIVSIPISVLFIIMQKFYVEGITGGAVKG
jgi:arabinogalactan oligomer/maltooligosaccharide transport system permease protein